MKTILNILSDGPTNKQDIEDLSQLSLAALEDDDEGYLEAYVKAKALSTALEGFRSLISKKALEEAQKSHSDKEKTFSVFGANVSVSELGTKYDYSKTNDFELPQYEQNLKSAQDSVKERQKYLQALSTPLTAIDPSTGEMVTLYKPIKTSTTGLKISFGKL